MTQIHQYAYFSSLSVHIFLSLSSGRKTTLIFFGMLSADDANARIVRLASILHLAALSQRPHASHAARVVSSRWRAIAALNVPSAASLRLAVPNGSPSFGLVLSPGHPMHAPHIASTFNSGLRALFGAPVRSLKDL